jgi:hypothetical protein
MRLGPACLEDEEAVVVQVHALGLEDVGDLGEVGGSPVEEVLAGIV